MKQNYTGPLMKIGISILILLTITVSSCSKGDSPQPIAPIIPPVIATPTVGSFSPTSAEAGKDITITGALFGTNVNAVIVKFADGASVVPKSVTPTQIIVTVPTTGKTGQITVIVNNGTSLITNDTFTILSAPPTITGFSPTSLNAGETVTITGTNFGSDVNSVTITLATGDVVKPKNVTNTQIVFDVPSTYGTGLFTVTISGKITIKTTTNLTIVNNNPVYEDIAISAAKIVLTPDNHLDVSSFEVNIMPALNVKYVKGGTLNLKLVNVSESNTSFDLTSEYNKTAKFKNVRSSTSTSVLATDSDNFPYMELSGVSLIDANTKRPKIIRYFLRDDGSISGGTLTLSSSQKFASNEVTFDYLVSKSKVSGLIRQ